MKIRFKKIVVALVLTGGISMANANVCNYLPGSVNCGTGTVSNLQGSGTVAANGTTVLGSTLVEGTLSADDANFNSLEVNGSVKLAQCTVNDIAIIRGSLSASSTKFEKSMKIYSDKTRFINSKVKGNLRLCHTDSNKQTVYLDNFSEVTGDIIFDDGAGEVILRGKSKIGGKVIGGQIVDNNLLRRS
jgi:hypothetical protein